MGAGAKEKGPCVLHLPSLHVLHNAFSEMTMDQSSMAVLHA